MLAPLALSLWRPALTRHLTDSAIEPIVERVIERDAVHVVIVAPRAAVINEEIERILRPVVGADDAHRSAPHGQRHRGFQYFLEIVDERGFIEHQALARSPFTTKIPGGA